MKKVFAGIDFGGTYVKIGFVAGHEIIAERHLEAVSQTPFAERLHTIAQELHHMLEINSWEITGIGFAFPGIVNFNTNAIISRYVKYPGAGSMDLNAWAKEHFGVPVVIENDARAALIGEWKYGAGRGYDNLVLVTLGTGVGTAVMLDGKLLRGHNFIAGNLGGHTTINLHGAQCNCGNIGCVESESSTWVLKQMAEKHPDFLTSKLSEAEVVDFRHLFESALLGDELAIELKNHCLTVWSFCVINLIHSYDPGKVILGGGIMKSAGIILPFIKNMIDRYAWINAADVELAEAAQLETAAVLGVYELFKQKYQ